MVDYIIHLSDLSIDINDIDEIVDETDSAITLSGRINGERQTMIFTGADAEAIKNWLDKDHERYIAHLESTGRKVANRERRAQRNDPPPLAIDGEPPF